MNSKRVSKKPSDRFTRRVNRMHKRYSKKRRGQGIPFSAMKSKYKKKQKKTKKTKKRHRTK